MRLARVLRSCPTSSDVPMRHIAALIEAATTARTSTTAVYRDDFGKRFTLHEAGVEDFANHLRSVRRTQDGAEHLHVGPDLLHRLPAEEQDKTGKAWRWEGQPCPYREGERTETAAALRLHVAEPRAAKIETVDGERLHRYVFRVEARRGHDNAVIAGMYDHMRYHQMTRVSLEVWLTDDGNLRRTREHAKAYHQAQGYTLRAWTTDHWDFGVTTEIAIPLPDQILKEPDGQGK